MAVPPGRFRASRSELSFDIIQLTLRFRGFEAGVSELLELLLSRKLLVSGKKDIDACKFATATSLSPANSLRACI